MSQGQGGQESTGPGNAPNDLQQMMMAALRAHQSGRLEQAEEGYRKILQKNPRQPDALHLLGVVAHQAGENEAAVQLMSQAIAVRPNDPDVHNNIGEAYRALGKFDDAITHYKRAQSLQPANPGAYCNMGSALIGQGKLDEAISAFKKALGFNPDFVEAKAKLAGAFLRLPHDDPQRDVDRAIGYLQEAIRVNPNFTEGYVNLGNALVEKGRNDEAISLYQTAVERRPRDANARFNLAALQLQNGQPGPALEQFEAALALAPQDVRMHQNAGHLLIGAEQLLAGIKCYEKAAQLAPDDIAIQEKFGESLTEVAWHEEAIEVFEKILAKNAELFGARISLGRVLKISGASNAAIENFQKAAEANPDRPMPVALIGATLQDKGEFEKAREYFHRALDMDAGNVVALTGLAADRGYDVDDSLVERLRSAAETDGPGRTTACFALAQILERRKEYDDAFRWFDQANRLTREEIDYQSVSAERRLEQTRKAFSGDFFKDRWTFGIEDERPVFVVGMPRSGTTLTEQILGSHRDAQGVGELNDVIRLTQTMHDLIGTKVIYPDCLKQLQSDHSAQLARRYLDKLDRLAPGKDRVIDKMPANFLNVGLIALLLPNAKIIHMRRDPMDNCLSCFQQSFRTAMKWSFDLTEIGEYYRIHDRYMELWREVCPIEIHEVQYEELVADTEKVARGMLDYIGLDWDPAVLKHHERDTTVLTASLWQARQPVYSSSVERWRRYEAHLGPLKKALGV